ncbi:AAA family ATPase [Sphingomonas aurantiaca]|uniref:AAA family ATPase n=1 Tax=Sphingomonas aurantiaca TaxID=185949 RepID=UPI003A5C2EF8
MLSRLVLTDFRNHADLTLVPGAGFVVLTGENGAGKTNILEAVSLLAPAVACGVQRSARWRARAGPADSASRRPCPLRRRRRPPRVSPPACGRG